MSMERIKYAAAYKISLNPVIHQSLDEIPERERIIVSVDEEEGTEVRGEYLKIKDNVGNGQVYEMIESRGPNCEKIQELIALLKESAISKAAQSIAKVKNQFSGVRGDAIRMSLDLKVVY